MWPLREAAEEHCCIQAVPPMIRSVVNLYRYRLDQVRIPIRCLKQCGEDAGSGTDAQGTPQARGENCRLIA